MTHKTCTIHATTLYRITSVACPKFPFVVSIVRYMVLISMYGEIQRHKFLLCVGASGGADYLGCN